MNEQIESQRKVQGSFKPHYLRESEQQLWDRYMTASLMGGSAPLEAARYADQAIEAHYRRFEFVIVNVGGDEQRMWVRNTRDTK